MSPICRCSSHCRDAREERLHDRVVAVGGIRELELHFSENTAVVIAPNTCPAHVQRIERSQLPAVRNAVLSALPKLDPKADLRAARAVQVRFTHAPGDVMPPRYCAAIDKSVLVHVLLPHEKLASLDGNPVYYVARTQRNWVMWFQAH